MTRTTTFEEHVPSVVLRLLVTLALALVCSVVCPVEARATEDDTNAPSSVTEEAPAETREESAPQQNDDQEPQPAAQPNANDASTPAPEPGADQTSTPEPEPEPQQAQAPQPAPTDADETQSEQSAETTPAPAMPDTGEGTPVQADATEATTFKYQHDPHNNPRAMADIVDNPSAVYGFSPSTTGSLKTYASFDWSNPAFVEGGRQERIAYHDSLAELYVLLKQMMAEGATTEQIARAVSTRRNELRIASYKDDPEGLARLKARNLELYGNENGGTPEFFYEKYGSWETVIDKSFSVNSGMDACLGLYDDYFYLYVLTGQVTEEKVSPTPAHDSTPAVAPAVLPGACAPHTALPATGDTSSKAPLALVAASAGVFLASRALRRKESKARNAA